MTRLRLRPSTAATAVLAVLCAQVMLGLAPGIAPEARADPESTNTGRTAPSMIVLDASGSMREADAQDQPRMDVAKEAIGQLIPLLPSDAQIGLMTYGNSTEAIAADKAEACKDIKVLVEPTGLDREALTAGIDAVTPRGFTPIGASLEKAVAELPEAEMRSVVLVSDGIEECSTTPPCEVARGIADSHPEVRIHTIGFLTDEEARSELACVAEATGGTYADATDAESLREELLLKMTRATQGYDTSGQPVSGGDSVETATEIGPGSYLDVLEHGSPEIDDGEGDARYYRLRLEEGEIAHLAASMVIPAGGGDSGKLAQLSMTTVDANGETCRIGSTEARAESELGQGPITVTASTPRKGETENLSCFGADADGEIILAIERSGTPSQEEAVPLELQFFAEQQVDAEGLPPAVEFPLSREKLPVAEDGTSFPPSFAFADATPLGDGPVRGTIIPGEVQFFRIPVQYGQQIRTSLEFGEVDVPGGMSLETQVSLVSPLRQDVYSVQPPSADGSAEGFRGPTKTGQVVQLNQATPVQFRNREEGGTEARSSFLSGDYYLKVAVVPDSYDASRLFEIGYVVDADLVGDVSEGPELDGQGDESRADSSAADPGAAPTAAADAPSDAGGESTPPQLQGPPEERGMPTLVWVVLGSVLGGVALAAGIIGIAVLVRRR